MKALLRARSNVVLVAFLILPFAQLFAQDWGQVEGPSSGAPESVGSYAAGCLLGGVRLPEEGAGYQAIRLTRGRHYGHPNLVRFIEDLSRQADQAGLGLLPVGDMSQPRGGPMIAAHASHQVGLDVDIFFQLNFPPLPREEREDIELPSLVDQEQRVLDPRFGEAHFTLLNLAARHADVARIFVSPYIKQAMCEQSWPDRSFLRTIRPWFGHEDHMHVRLDCPSDSTDCVDQAAPPAGDGCGVGLDSWFDRGQIPTRPPGARREPELPVRCDLLPD